MNDSEQQSTSIRDARPGDLKLVKRLYRQISSDVSNVDENYPKILEDSNTTFLILEVDSRPIGFVNYSVHISVSSGKHIIIDDLVVDDNHRRQGQHGGELMKHCIMAAKKEGCDCIQLCCSNTKSDLHRFYESLGFIHRMRMYSLILPPK